MVRQQREIGPGGLLIANPIPEDKALDAGAIEARIAEAVAEAKARGIGKKEVTPFLLGRIVELTEGTQPRSEHGVGQEQRDVGGAGRGELVAAVTKRAGAPRILVIGDVMVDILVRPGADLRSARTGAPRSSRGQVDRRQSGRVAAHFGAAVDFVARVGAVDRRREASRLSRAGVTPHLVGDAAARPAG